jgi:hypothetical protein
VALEMPTCNNKRIIIKRMNIFALKYSKSIKLSVSYIRMKK